MSQNEMPNLNQTDMETNKINNNTENNIKQSTNPVPINNIDVKVESNTETSQNSNSQNSNNSVSIILLILLFIFLFSFIFGMPYINEFINNIKNKSGLSTIEQEAKKEEQRQQEEEKKNNSSNKTTEQLTQLTCTLSDTSNQNYSLISIQQFDYNSKNEIITSSIKLEYTFKTVDETYNNLKTKCDRDSLKYIGREGYTMACNYNDNSIEISDTFNLETFKTINDGTTVIQANTTYKQNVKTIKTNLINEGYTCK